MPPRKAAPAVEDHCSSLKLIMEKGPLSGQVNDFRPGSRIRIGRVVRGNTLAIKDAGISTKHLIIQTEPIAGGCHHWTVTDLGSSNGTFLNDERLEPSEPASLSDGDVFIIGEQTSIRVRFVDSAGEAVVSTRDVSRNARRVVSKQVEELGIIDEDSELGLGIKYSLRTGVRNKKYVEFESGGGKLGVVREKKATGRRTRGSKTKELKNGSIEEIKSVAKASLKRTRNSKKDEKLQNIIIGLDEDEEKNNEVAGVEGKQEKNMSTRGTRSAKNKNLMNDLNIDDVNKDLEPSGVKIMERVSVRRTKNSRKEENTDEPLIDLSVIEGKRTRKGTRGRKIIAVETPLDIKEKELNLEEQKVCAEEKKISEVGVDERATLERENATEFARRSGVEEDGVEAGNGEIVVDLKKMMLGKWFEFLEDYLPRQIVDETEEMISEMRREAERLHEFVLQKKKNVTEKGDDMAMDEKIG